MSASFRHCPDGTMDFAGMTAHVAHMAEVRSTSNRVASLEAHALKLESDGEWRAAKEAYDAALAVHSRSQSCIDGRARVALQLGEGDAVEYCARALALRADDPALQSQMIRTVAAQLGTDAIPLAESFVRDHPEQIAMHELLADLRLQAGAGDSFASSYQTALQNIPDHKRLLMSYWHVLSRSGRYLQTLESMDAKRPLFDGDRSFALLEVAVSGHCGQTERAALALAKLDHAPDAQLARAQHRLQSGDVDEASSLLADVTDREPANLTAWALSELAWRLTGNPRHDWLVGSPPLYGTIDLALAAEELEQIAAKLRALHKSRAQPIGQSVRGGTQTNGNLFARNEVEIRRLIEAIQSAVRQFVGRLPAMDSTHPLLRYRDRPLAFGPSWSVRLVDGGFHAAHFHPGGVLSSACYISLPGNLAERDEQEGWLELGRPPQELMLDLPALASFEPKPGALILFPSFLFHGTRPFKAGERLTVAFDVTAL